jgi:beta-glucosidase
MTASAQAPAPDSAAIEQKAHEMLSKLTLEQKIKLLGGVDSMYTQAEPAINLPRFKMSDASVGVRTWGPTTAYAGGVALAATWDRDFARKLGESLGRDARARGVNFLLGPGVNIARSPINGRNFEYLSEDPFLNAEIVVPYIAGLQSQGVIATVKHFALNNSEFDRHNGDVQIDERTMREIYLPAFEAAITKGHADAVMNSYNLVNGVHATQNEFLNLKLLKDEWGFKGILMSDWNATYDGVAAANNGLDLEMPNAQFMNEKTLLPAVRDGRVKESAIDDKVLRLLRTELRYGFTDRPQLNPADGTYSVKGSEVALEGARESITLLKNDGNILPLDAAKIKTIAVIGPDAWPAVPGGGGSALPTPFASVSAVEGIGKLVGPNVSLLYAAGVPSLPDLFRNTHWDGNVKVETYANRDFSGEAVTTNARSVANWNYAQWGPEGDPRSVRYTAVFKADKAGKYVLATASSGDDVYKVAVDGKPVLTQADAEAESPQTYALDLAAGQSVQLDAEYLPHSPGVAFGMGLLYEPDMIPAETKEMAAKADAVIVCVGFGPTTESEGKDRSFDLPWGQDELVNAMVAANPRTVVVLTGGGSMNITRWIDKVPALVDSWYPGQEGGTAIAEVLFGKRNPEGKLPVSWDRAWEDDPTAKWYYGDPSKDTTMQSTYGDGKLKDLKIRHIPYGEKLMVGYRYWTTTGKHPLYPFGYGLSYTTFKFDKLKAPATAASGSTVPVSFDVTNSGKVAGSEVAEVYVSDPSTKVDRPERELKGFEKVHLEPGETKHVTLNLDARAFSYWSESAQKWTIDPGKFVVRVGDSSENTPLTAEVALQ